jgi:D-alanyl-D-alanine carboxypeptidase/D-alanyl-D-alanine-endopeptidase (penicillin-binding protein 4)
LPEAFSGSHFFIRLFKNQEFPVKLFSMRKNHLKLKVIALLTFVALSIGFNFGAPAAAQEASRERVSGKPTPTPKTSPALSPTPTPILTPTPIQTVADLQSKIRATLSRPELRRGSVGVKIVSLDTNRTIFEENAAKYFMPASNMKSYTVAAALEKLSPIFGSSRAFTLQRRPTQAEQLKAI